MPIDQHLKAVLWRLQQADKKVDLTRTHMLISPDALAHFTRQMKHYGYQGRSRNQGISPYLVALFAANPTPDDWTDTRPESLRDFDLARLERGLFPLWFEENSRGTVAGDIRYIRTSAWDAILPTLTALSDHFGIKSPFYTKQRPNGYAVLDAVGLIHLTPTNPPERCKFERDLKQARYRENNRRRYQIELT